MQTEFSERNIFLDGDDESVNLPIKVERLFEDQLQNWKLAFDGYQSLTKVQKKLFEFDDFSIEAHYNPGRIISSSAKVDAKSINERPCFLCVKNLPADQKAIKVIGNYILLVNPFPIFHKHFTIPTTKHVPQLIKQEFENLLLISSKIGSGFSVFYNGPKCGASAPDHLHFQAGNYGFMNIDNEYENILNKYGEIVYSDGELITSVVTGCLRNFITVESNDISKLKSEFEKIYNVLGGDKTAEEPMLNVISTYNNSWRVLIFPRTKHRPSYFFGEGKNKILISPAAVDLGGVLIFPREEDFDKITIQLVVDIFKQVTFTNEEFRNISDKLKIR
jgi:ATP adenylyltransferase/5',5'''-P-1,P-4-tetraphosphate phosphorylase II